MIRACADHGYFDGCRCPACGDPGREVLDEEHRTRLSKFASGALRHFPGDAGIELDDRGWTRFDDLVTGAVTRYDWVDREHVEGVVATDPKGRFEHSGGKIRAAYGHSVDVTVDDDIDGGDVPVVLYHGTARRNVDSILSSGLEPMGRRRVHLSGTVDGAETVSRRHDDDPVVLEIAAAAMIGDGHEITKRGPTTFTTRRVPPPYVTVLDGR